MFNMFLAGFCASTVVVCVAGGRAGLAALNTAACAFNLVVALKLL